MQLNPREQYHLDNALHFNAVRGRSPRNRIKCQFHTLEDAREFAATFGDGRTMIYAVSEFGSGHICNA